MYSLVLTLGHNSSAILINDRGSILCGYETERLSEIKADSKFPYLPILEIAQHYSLVDVREIFVSHWETFADINQMSEKHWDVGFLRQNMPGAKIFSHRKGITHHDAHFYAARTFAGRPYEWHIVADGFGNYNEVISIYHKDNLVHRCFGFDKSIGLLYQYTTAYLGLKMNQDEYKLLGFESKIHSYFSGNDLEKLHTLSNTLVSRYVRKILRKSLEPKFDLVAGIDALPEFRQEVARWLDDVCNQMGIMDANIECKRTVIAYFVQRTVEQIFIKIIDHFDMTEICLSGGVFMNVKLNNVISNLADVCIYPICGDQGAGLGVYNYYKGNTLESFNNLFWGIRQWHDFPNDEPGIEICVSERHLFVRAKSLLDQNKIVNVVYGNMEFGARALGHTSTLALPYEENVEYINMMNNRDTIMPMAGMVSLSALELYHLPDITKSLEYMIITLDLKGYGCKREIKGCHHRYPTSDLFSNRVQLVSRHGELNRLVDSMPDKMIINTSFNRHGVPIVHDSLQIVDTHRYQRERDIENRMVTLVCKEY